jgi:hypothetical protein
MLDEDVCHVEAFFSLGDVQVAFRIFSMFCPKTFLFASLLPSFITLLAPAHLFQLNLHASFWETLGPKLFELPISPLNALTRFSPHLSWVD